MDTSLISVTSPIYNKPNMTYIGYVERIWFLSTLTQNQRHDVRVKYFPKPQQFFYFIITMAFDFEDLLFQLEEAENGNEMLEAIDAYVEGVA